MVVLGLGVNLGERMRQLRDAVAALRPLLCDMRCSPVYESEALLPENAPPEWNRDFLNMAVVGETELSPQALLAEIKTIERRLGRVAVGHWGPRAMDIDILAYGDRVIASPDLTVPHRDLLRRDFALQPLADIAPDWVYPAGGEAQGKTARELAAAQTSALRRVQEAFA